MRISGSGPTLITLITTIRIAMPTRIITRSTQCIPVVASSIRVATGLVAVDGDGD